MPRTIAGPDLALQIARFVGDRIEDAAILLHPRLALGRRPGAAEHPFERGARVDLHRVRLRLGRPGDRVHVGAGIAGHAAADVAAEVLSGNLHRRKRRVLTDLLGNDLIDADADLDVLGLGLLGDRAAQPAGGADGVVGHRLAARPRQVAEQVQAVTERLERLEDGLELEAGARRVRHPVLRRRAVGKVDGAEALRRRGRRLGQRGERRDHRFEQRQRHRGADSAQERAPGQCSLGDKHALLRTGRLKAAPTSYSSPATRI